MTEYRSLCWIKKKKKTSCNGNKYSIAGWCAEATAREAETAKWKIPAEDVFLFPVGRKRVLLGAGSSVENTQSATPMTKRPN